MSKGRKPQPDRVAAEATSDSRTRIVIVGRPNVGKSTLFNRLFGRRRALVHDEPGVTRDRLEEVSEWWVRGRLFKASLVDTGGLGGDRFAEEIARQVDIAIREADIVLVLMDGRAGYTTADEEVIRSLKQSGVLSGKIPVIGVVNKVDAEVHEHMISEFFESRLDPILTISAEHGRGISDLQEAIFDLTGGVARPDDEAAEPEAEFELDTYGMTAEEIEAAAENEAAEAEDAYVPKTPRVAIVGRPNAGKSTMVNALLGEHRMIVSPIAGTTVDAVDSVAQLNGKTFVLVDTAGVRRKSKTEKGIEVLSVVQTRKALENCDVAVLVMDVESGLTDQDEKLGGLIEEAGCGVILVLNKWDTQLRILANTREKAAEALRNRMAYLRYAPVVFTSGLRGEGFEDLGDLVEEIMRQRRLKIPTHEFTEWVREESAVHNPDSAKFYLCHQSGRNPPTFVCHVSDPKKVHFSLSRHLINALRKRWGFMGSPVRMLFIQGKNTRTKPKKNWDQVRK